MLIIHVISSSPIINLYIFVHLQIYIHTCICKHAYIVHAYKRVHIYAQKYVYIRVDLCVGLLLFKACTIIYRRNTKVVSQSVGTRTKINIRSVVS